MSDRAAARAGGARVVLSLALGAAALGGVVLGGVAAFVALGSADEPEASSAAPARRAGEPTDERAGELRALASAAAVPAPEPSAAPPAAELPAHVRWLGVGGGAEPELNQLSLEEDLLLAREVLGEGGVVLFAGGPGTRSVQVADDAERGDPLLRELGDLLAGRGGRDTRYQPTRLAAHGPATLDRTIETLQAALRDGDDPLLLWIAAHGDRGERPLESTVLLWAGTALDPLGLYETVAGAEPTRPLQMVITSCYSGGFAELAFDRGEPARGATPLEVCGFFAASWDEEASGCDPHPDRATHEAWSIHVLEALRGRDRSGRDARAAIDLDRDDRISLAEADAYARIAALSFDLPTNTSARLLRELAPRSGRAAAVSLPPEESVVRAIGERLGIRDEHDAQARLDALARRRVELEAAYEERHAEADELWWALAGELLSRWPVIDDPWHPDFEPTIAREGAAIRAFLERSEERVRWLEAQDDLHAMDGSLASLQVQAAPLRRWLEARETIELAGRLRARGGASWARFERMRACEAGVPRAAP